VIRKRIQQFRHRWICLDHYECLVAENAIVPRAITENKQDASGITTNAAVSGRAVPNA
jgi:hypothetical protein